MLPPSANWFRGRMKSTHRQAALAKRQRVHAVTLLGYVKAGGVA